MAERLGRQIVALQETAGENHGAPVTSRRVGLPVLGLYGVVMTAAIVASQR